MVTAAWAPAAFGTQFDADATAFAFDDEAGSGYLRFYEAFEAMVILDLVDCPASWEIQGSSSYLGAQEASGSCPDLDGWIGDYTRGFPICRPGQHVWAQASARIIYLLAVPDEDVDIAEDVCAQDAESLGPENCFGFEGIVGAERCQQVLNVVASCAAGAAPCDTATDCFDNQHVCDKLVSAVSDCLILVDSGQSDSDGSAQCIDDPCEGPLGQGCAEWVADCIGGGACESVADVLRLLDQVIAAVCGNNNEQCSI